MQTTLTAPATVPADRSTVVDMYTPSETGLVLGVDDHGLIDLVNTGTLPAYRIGGCLRFRAAHVHTVAEMLLAA